MTNRIKILRSSTTTIPTTLPYGELAYSTATGKNVLFIGNVSDTPIQIGADFFNGLNSQILHSSNFAFLESMTNATNVLLPGVDTVTLTQIPNKDFVIFYNRYDNGFVTLVGQSPITAIDRPTMYPGESRIMLCDGNTTYTLFSLVNTLDNNDNIITFNLPGVYNWIMPSGVKYIDVSLIGGGGGSGNVNPTSGQNTVFQNNSFSINLTSPGGGFSSSNGTPASFFPIKNPGDTSSIISWSVSGANFTGLATGGAIPGAGGRAIGVLSGAYSGGNGAQIFARIVNTNLFTASDRNFTITVGSGGTGGNGTSVANNGNNGAVSIFLYY